MAKMTDPKSVNKPGDTAGPTPYKEKNTPMKKAGGKGPFAEPGKPKAGKSKIKTPKGPMADKRC